MVTIWLAMEILLASPAQPVPATSTTAVVVGIVRGGEGVTPRPGSLLYAKDEVQTERTGWCEVELLRGGRLRMFARTEVRVAPGTFDLQNGRVWFDAHRMTELKLRGAEGRLVAGTSLIIEDTLSAGLVLAVRKGKAQVGSVEIGEGMVWRRPLLGSAGAPRPGGNELADLLRRQVHDSIGDWSGLERWLREELMKTMVGPPEGLTVGGVVRSEQEVSIPSPGDLLTESALRPPPFFEDEVPPPGPNVQVDIDFSED